MYLICLIYFSKEYPSTFVTAGCLTKLLMQTSSTANTKSCTYSNNEFHCFLGCLFSRFQEIWRVKSQINFRFIYMECYLLWCWLFMAYVFSSRENIFIDQHYMPYLSCIYILMLWSRFTPISGLKDWCGTLCNFQAYLSISFVWKTFYRWVKSLFWCFEQNSHPLVN